MADRNITSVYTEGWIAFKEFVLNICSLHNGGLSCDIRFRVNSGISTLYAADAKHHQDWKILLLHSKYVKLLASKASETLEE